MNFDSWPQTGDVLQAFSQEIAELGGVVTESVDDGTRLYARSTLPDLRELSVGDKVQGGVAIRVTDEDIRVHPYVFRIVCSNGAIRADAIQTRIIERDHLLGAPIAMFCDAVRDCAQPTAFNYSMREMRSAMAAEASLVLTLMPALAMMPAEDLRPFLAQIFHQFREAGDRSGFGMMNAVTATARETRDPEARWKLESLGGGIGAVLQSIEPLRRRSAGRVAEDVAGIVA